MTGGHILVACVDGVGAGELAELLVHVVSSRAGIVAEPDAKVLDLERLPLGDLQRGSLVSATLAEIRFPTVSTHFVDGDELSCGLLDLPELPQVVPEAGLCDHLVGREDAHAVQLGAGILVRGQLAPNDLILGESRGRRHLLAGSTMNVGAEERGNADAQPCSQPACAAAGVLTSVSSPSFCGTEASLLLCPLYSPLPLFSFPFPP